MRTKTLEALKKARALLCKEARWIKGDYARNNEGGVCPANDEDAKCWCSVGALKRVAYADTFQTAIEALDEALKYDSRAMGTSSIDRVINFNDNEDTHHSDVLRAYEFAITLLEAGTTPGAP